MQRRKKTRYQPPLNRSSLTGMLLHRRGKGWPSNNKIGAQEITSSRELISQCPGNMNKAYSPLTVSFYCVVTPDSSASQSGTTRKARVTKLICRGRGIRRITDTYSSLLSRLTIFASVAPLNTFLYKNTDHSPGYAVCSGF